MCARASRSEGESSHNKRRGRRDGEVSSLIGTEVTWHILTRPCEKGQGGILAEVTAGRSGRFNQSGSCTAYPRFRGRALGNILTRLAPSLRSAHHTTE